MAEKQALTPAQQELLAKIDPNDLTRRYLALRQMLEQLEKAHKDQTAKIKDGMTRIESMMLLYLTHANAESIRLEAGTPYITEKTGANVSDADAFMKWVGEDFDERYVFLTNKAAKSSVKEFMDENKGQLPPGVTWYSELAVNFKTN